MKTLDSVDRAIVTALHENCRTSISDIARHVNRSRTAVETRIKKLEESGIILGYSAIINKKYEEDCSNQAFISIRHSGGADCAEIWKEIKRFPQIVECHSLFGDLDLIAKVKYADLESLMTISNCLSQHPKVRTLVVSPVITTWID